MSLLLIWWNRLCNLWLHQVLWTIDQKKYVEVTWICAYLLKPRLLSSTNVVNLWSFVLWVIVVSPLLISSYGQEVHRDIPAFIFVSLRKNVRNNIGLPSAFSPFGIFIGQSIGCLLVRSSVNWQSFSLRRTGSSFYSASFYPLLCQVRPF